VEEEDVALLALIQAIDEAREIELWLPARRIQLVIRAARAMAVGERDIFLDLRRGCGRP